MVPEKTPTRSRCAKVYLEEGHEDRREHPAVTCNINRQGDESEPAPHALPCASLSDHPTASEGVPHTIATAAVACAFRVSAGRDCLPSGPSAARQGCGQTIFLPVFSGLPYPLGAPQPASAPESGLLMPKTSAPGRYGKLPNRRSSMAPVGGCGSKRVSLTLCAHRAYNAN